MVGFIGQMIGEDMMPSVDLERMETNEGVVRGQKVFDSVRVEMERKLQSQEFEGMQKVFIEGI